MSTKPLPLAFERAQRLGNPFGWSPQRTAWLKSIHQAQGRNPCGPPSLIDIPPSERIRRATMADPWATISASLIGAGLGSLGTKVYENLSRNRAEREELRREVVDRYLLQLQDGVDDLWYRLDNLKNRGGQVVMTNEYFEISTLYALGRVLAYERIFLLDGIYPQLERLYPGAGIALRTNLRSLDQQLNQRSFHRYNRLALAESVLERAYTAENSLERASLALARKYIAAMTDKELSELLKSLREIAHQVADRTGLPSAIKSLTRQPPSAVTGG
jgi:hypothetical protein